MYRLPALMLFLFVISSKVSGQERNVDYKLYHTKVGKEVTIDELVLHILPRQVLIFGEQHDDSIGHLLELEIYKKLYSRFGKRTLLSLEMFERDVQSVMNEYLQHLISEKNFVKESRAWANYKDYRGLIEYAKDNGLSVVAANTPARYVNRVTREGLQALERLSKDALRQYLPPLPIDTLTGNYHDRFMEVMGGHDIPGMNMYQSQNLWDATMAWSIYKATKQAKDAVVFQINGRFHSDYHSGLGERLRQSYKKDVLTISCIPVENIDQPDWTEYHNVADFVILTLKP